MKMTRLKKRKAQQVWVLVEQISEPPNDAKGKLVLIFKGDFRKPQQHQHLHGIHNSLLIYQPE